MQFKKLCKTEPYEALDFVRENTDELFSESELKERAKRAIDEDEFLLAIHLLKGIQEEGESPESFYQWCWAAGTLSLVRGVNNPQELYETYVDCCSDYTTAADVPPYYTDDEEEN